MTKLIETIEWNDENVKNFWDFYSHYPEFYFTYRFGKQIVNTLLPFMKTNAHVLDYGCGTGFLIKNLVGTPVRVYGTDSSTASLIAVARQFGNEENFGGVYGIEKILSDEKFTGFFDVVCLIEVVEHLSDRHLDSVIRNAKKLLKKDGILAITTPNEETLSDSYVYCPESKKVFHRWQHVRTWSTQSITGCLREYGVEPVEVFATDFTATGSKRVNIKSMVRDVLTGLGLLQKKTASLPHLVYVGMSKAQ